jgi:hypothetical protein
MLNIPLFENNDTRKYYFQNCLDFDKMIRLIYLSLFFFLLMNPMFIGILSKALHQLQFDHQDSFNIQSGKQ